MYNKSLYNRLSPYFGLSPWKRRPRSGITGLKGRLVFMVFDTGCWIAFPEDDV